MKLTTILLLAAILQTSAKGTAQTVTYSAKAEKLQKVFTVIKQQTGYVFFYRKEDLKDAKPVTVELKNENITTALEKLLSGQPLQFEIQGNTIVISQKQEEPKKKEEAETITTAPPSIITGVVKDTSGVPLSGATVTNKRTKKTTQTNVKGEFNIEAEEGDVLQLTFIGFEGQSLTVKGSSVLAVLNVSSSPLDEVQVMAYGKTSRRYNTGSIVSVKSDEIARQPIDNPLLSLQGRVPNLTITPTSGQFGATVSLQLRGQNSLLGLRSEPLIVIDGVPYSNNIPGANYIGGNIQAIGKNTQEVIFFVQRIEILSIVFPRIITCTSFLPKVI